LVSRRRRVWSALGACGVVIILAVAAGWFFWLPAFRPALRAGEAYGIDVSAYQGRIDWRRVAGQQVSFAYIKASEGGDFVDRRFAANWSGAGRAGVPHGAYHFFSLCTPGLAQARNFLRVVPARSRVSWRPRSTWNCPATAAAGRPVARSKPSSRTTCTRSSMPCARPSSSTSVTTSPAGITCRCSTVTRCGCVRSSVARREAGSSGKSTASPTSRASAVELTSTWAGCPSPPHPPDAR
jgi:hypothetical protein